jgi:fructokinase
MHQEQLFPMIRKEVEKLNNGYISLDVLGNLDEYIVPASLNDNQGIMGAIALGYQAANEK